MQEISKIIKHCLTGIDGETYDPARIYGALAVFTFLSLAVFSVAVHKNSFNAQDFGIGFGALLLGFGIGVGAKSGTEPGEENK